MDRLTEYLHNHPVLSGLAVLAAIVVLAYEWRARAQNYSALQPQEAIRLMNQGAQLLDVRAPEAFAAGHIAGARNFSAEQLGDAANTLKKFRERPVILYCDTGAQGAAAVKRLHTLGFTQVFNIRGGVNAWRAESLPLQRT
jgi:rhodanese-related sulfurtransferase